jgi:mono/diheme cytochrome c family protein
LFSFLQVALGLLDNQIIKSESLIPKVVLVILALICAALVAIMGLFYFRAPDPYAQSVLSLSGNTVQGHAIFMMNCAGCHGAQADGRVGPSLLGVSDRKSKISLIHQVTSGQTPPMPQFQPSPQEMADLLSYLESL